MTKGRSRSIVVIAAIIAAAILYVPDSLLAEAPNTASVPYVEARTIALQQAFHTKRDWHVTAYKPQGSDAETGDLPVKICFWFDTSKKDDDCATIGSKDYPAQNLSEFAIVPLVKSSQPLSGVLVDAFFSGGGSGIARNVSISIYDKENDDFSSAVSIDLSEIGEYHIISNGALSGSILTASGLWQQDEGHFGEHRFWIQVYKYSSYYGRYEKLIGYLTSKKYPSEHLGVIAKEDKAVSEMLAKIYGAGDPLTESAKAHR